MCSQAEATPLHRFACKTSLALKWSTSLGRRSSGLKGLPQALETVFPRARVQLCIVHLVGNCLNYASWKERKTVAAELKPIYRAATAEVGWDPRKAFAEKGDARDPSISQMWKRNWEQVRPFSPIRLRSGR